MLYELSYKHETKEGKENLFKEIKKKRKSRHNGRNITKYIKNNAENNLTEQITQESSNYFQDFNVNKT